MAQNLKRLLGLFHFGGEADGADEEASAGASAARANVATIAEKQPTQPGAVGRHFGNFPANSPVYRGRPGFTEVFHAAEIPRLRRED
jgi:hypothetical protein